jgi:hypothetical protein
MLLEDLDRLVDPVTDKAALIAFLRTLWPSCGARTRACRAGTPAGAY